ncbi:MAG: aminotransferase class V-fold PLP-dependent enzyme, partial [Solirubrobacteraceae bacterium]
MATPMTTPTTATPADYDVSRIRALYPALADGWAYLDGAAGTQVPRAVIEAEAGAYTAGIGNVGGAFAASRRSEALTAGARAAVADLVGA